MEEKKSLEGGNGLSTTTKNILLYKKSSLALRFYDVKGLEDETTLNNYVKLLKGFNGNNNLSNDSINAIFYCIPYGEKTIIKEPDKKIINELIEFDIPILFLFTQTPYDIRKKESLDREEFRRLQRENKKTVILSAIKNCFMKKNREAEKDNYIYQFIRFYFVNLVEDFSLNVPVFGIDEVLSFFKNSVPEKDWQSLRENCQNKNIEKCKDLCKKNPFLKKFAEIDKINERNKYEAEEYLNQLKIATLFSSAIPIIDMISENKYENLFKNRLETLYGLKYKKAEANNYINQFIRFYFVNLVEDFSLNVPVFGIDEVLSFFKNSVPEKDWESLRENCQNKDIEKCQDLCKKNPFLKKFAKIDKINERNKYKAEEYLNQLKIATLFSSAIPFIDMASEKVYKILFKNRLETLYGLKCEKAEEKLNNTKKSFTENLIEVYSKLKEKEENSSFIQNENQTPINKVKNNINNSIDSKCNHYRKIILNLLKRSADVALPVVGFTAKTSLKTASIVFFPITTVVAEIWSRYNLDKECRIYLDIFDKAFTKIKFEVLEHYVNSFIEIINKLDSIGKNLVK